MREETQGDKEKDLMARNATNSSRDINMTDTGTWKEKDWCQSIVLIEIQRNTTPAIHVHRRKAVHAAKEVAPRPQFSYQTV
jgi:hypothetical protein